MLFNETNFIQEIFKSKILHFDELAVRLFQHQYEHNPVYRSYCNHLNTDTSAINSVAQIPFLPVSFFKTHNVQTGIFTPEAIYTSSATTGMTISQHPVKNNAIYIQSFTKAFELFYGDPSQYAILALLPNYIEREGSSLIVMADHLIGLSKQEESGFYLYNFEELHQTLVRLKAKKTKVLLLGVTFALLDFAEQFPIDLSNDIIMETGGMKGRRKEMIRAEVHAQLQAALNVKHVHSEYGMTELLSQGYSSGEGIFYTPPWMKVTVSDATDALQLLPGTQTGLINVIDLANIHSCAFIQTADIGKIHIDGGFEVLGRLDQSDMRGCSLMYL
ncbi:MAG: acyl transferase [Bacteroidota bacterium]